MSAQNDNGAAPVSSRMVQKNRQPDTRTERLGERTILASQQGRTVGPERNEPCDTLELIVAQLPFDQG